jgi:hypothetical protein
MRSEFIPLNADNLIPANNDGPVASIGPFALALHLNCVAINAKDDHLIPSADVAFVDGLDK